MDSCNRISHFSFYIPILFAIVVFIGCKENSTVSIQSSTPQNTPVVVSTTNAFTYAIDANAYTASTAYDLAFSTDSLAGTLAIGGYLFGNASLYIRDSTNSIVFNDSVTTNQTIVIAQAGKGIPKRFTLSCNNFTGKISFVLSYVLGRIPIAN
jgi:hypothetical protein